MKTDLLLEKLVALLNEECRLYRLLLLVLQKERRAIIDSQLVQVTECTKEKENLILKLRVLEEQRINYLNNLAAHLDGPVESLSLGELSNLVDEPYATQLSDCSTSLGALIQSIQEINQANKTLVSHSLDLIRGSLTLLNDLISHNAVYYQTGKMQAGERSGMVLSKSA